MFMITSRVGLLGACFLVCFLICSITPISALEIGSVENNNITNYFTDENIGDSDNLIGSEVGGLYYLNQIHRPDDGPDSKVTCKAVIITLIVVTAIVCYLFLVYFPAKLVAQEALVMQHLDQEVAAAQIVDEMKGLPVNTIDKLLTGVNKPLNPKYCEKIMDILEVKDHETWHEIMHHHFHIYVPKPS